MSSSKCSFTCICGFFYPYTLPRLQFMLGLHFTPACVLLLVCSLHFTHSLHFTPGPQSEVRSPQSAVRSLPFTLTECKIQDSGTLMRSYTSGRKKQNCGVVPRVSSRKANTLGKTLDQLGKGEYIKAG